MPFNDQFLFSVAKLDRITTHGISTHHNNNPDNMEVQLKFILDRAFR